MKENKWLYLVIALAWFFLGRDKFGETALIIANIWIVGYGILHRLDQEEVL